MSGTERARIGYALGFSEPGDSLALHDGLAADPARSLSVAGAAVLAGLANPGPRATSPALGADPAQILGPGERAIPARHDLGQDDKNPSPSASTAAGPVSSGVGVLSSGFSELLQARRAKSRKVVGMAVTLAANVAPSGWEAPGDGRSHRRAPRPERHARCEPTHRTAGWGPGRRIRCHTSSLSPGGPAMPRTGFLVSLFDQHHQIAEWAGQVRAASLLEAGPLDRDQIAALARFYREEVLQHFRYEEQRLFPALAEVSGSPALVARVRAFEAEHEELLLRIEILLGDLTALAGATRSAGEDREFVHRARLTLDRLLEHAQEEDAVLLPAIERHRAAILASVAWQTTG